MASSARVLLLDPPHRYGDLAARIEAEGYASLVAHDIEEARSLLREAEPDIAIVAVEVGTTELPDALSEIRSKAPMPLIVLESEPADEDVSRNGVDAMTEYLAEPFSDVELFSRLQALSRLVTMQAELVRRDATARACGVAGGIGVAPPDKVAGAQILIVAGPELNIAEIHAVLGKNAVLAVVEETHAARRRLEHGGFDAALIYAKSGHHGWLELCQGLRQNTRLYDLPVLVVADGGTYRELEAAYEAGVTDMLRLEMPVEEVAFRTLSAVRQQRYRRTIQRLCRECRHESTSDHLTGLYNRDFLLAHLDAEIDDAARWNKALSLGYVEVSDLAQVEESLNAAAGQRIVQQTGGLVGALVRGEDLPARYGDDSFCIVLPNTSESAARLVLRRVAAVINNTTLNVADTEAPIGVHVRTGCAELAGDETSAMLIEKARAGLAP
ncbi:MAG: diguanylate cyclase [Alphaproteobacteria bacterium]|jgi:two-component system cell cycle response regulator|nr:diguanylate cyclase [Alphaproteobacteria bacterium]